jgi:hypothetical protein
MEEQTNGVLAVMEATFAAHPQGKAHAKRDGDT